MTKMFMIAALLTITVHGSRPGLDRRASEADLLRAFAFGSCLGTAYQQTSFGEDAERTADLYMQGGRLGGDAYLQMRKAIPSDLAKPSAYDGHNYAIMKCLEFYESEKLKQLARRTATAPRNR